MAREPAEVAERRRALGRSLATFRRAAQLTQAELARRLHYQRASLSNIENGHQPSTRQFWQRADTALAAGGVLLRDYDELVAVKQAHQAARTHRGPIGQQGQIGSLSDESLELTSLLAGLTTHRLPLFDSGEDVFHIGISASTGESLNAKVDLLLQLFLYLDNELGGNILYLPLSRYVARLAVTVERDPGLGLAAFGQLSQMVGWLALDANRHGRARRYFTTALYVAHETDDPRLAASALAYISLQETYRERFGSALSLAETALATGNGNLTPLTRTMLSTRLARAYAGVGNATRCLGALDQAHAVFSDAGSDQEPLWISYVDRIEVAAQVGACYLDLGMTTKASASLIRALDLLQADAPHRVRDRVHYLSRLAKCFLLDREVERACEVAAEAVTLSGAIGSARVTERLKEFTDALKPFEHNKMAQEFHELFASKIGEDS